MLMKNTLSLTDFVDLTGSDSFELLDNERISSLTGLPVKRILSSTRMKQRYILKKEKTPFDIALEVAQKFLEKTNTSEKDYEALALSHTHYIGDDTHRRIAECLADTLHIDKTKVDSITFGCAGFPEIVSRAAKLAERIDDDKRVLIVTAETPDRMLSAADPMATPIFAAGASATSLWRGQGHRLIFADATETDKLENPQNVEIFRVTVEKAPDFFGDERERKIVHMNGDLAFENGRALIEQASFESLRRVMAHPEFHARKVYVVPHQPNVRMLNLFRDYTAKEMMSGEFAQYEISDVRFVDGMEGMGNTISTTIPSTLARIDSLTDPPPQSGDIVLFPAAGICVEHPGTRMKQGFGAMEW